MNYKNFEELYNMEERRISKHVQTGWLSLGKFFNWQLNQWEDLIIIFKEEYSNMNRSKQSLCNLSSASYLIPKLKQ